MPYNPLLKITPNPVTMFPEPSSAEDHEVFSITTAGRLRQPWKEMDPTNTLPLPLGEETWMDTLSDDRDISATSLGSCLQARVKMNLVM